MSEIKNKGRFIKIMYPSSETPMKSTLSKEDLSYKFAVELIDFKDKVLENAIVDAAKKVGITELWLIDKPFILRAIRHEIERESKNKSNKEEKEDE